MTKKFFQTNIALLLLGAMFATFLPAPTDFIHFWLQKYLFENAATISRTAYLLWQAFDWYILDSFWYAFLILLTYFLHIRKKKTIETITIVATVISVGVAIGLITKFLLN